MILVDTSVWSIGLRRRRRDLSPFELTTFYAWGSLLKRGEATLIGPIRQELLSGVVHKEEFSLLKQRLDLITYLTINIETFTLAAEFYNTCRSNGIAPGPIDMTISAAAHLHNPPIFTTDPDFPRYAKLLPIALFHP